MQHIPSFIYRAEKPTTVEFETTEQLLSLEIVQRYTTRKDFSHFAIDDNCLIEVSDHGFYFWVVGYIKYPKLVDLPKWEGWKFRAELPNGEKVILNDEDVVSSCGDVLTLKDGTKARNLGYA